MGSNFVAPLILFVARRSVFITASIRRGRSIAYTLPVFGVVFFAARAACCWFRRCVPILMPLFWFLAKVGFLLFVFIWIRARCRVSVMTN